MSLSLSWTRYRRAAAEPAAEARAVLHFHGGERLVVDVDAENGGHLRAGFDRRGKRPFDWFETTDGFLIGVDLAAIEAIDWQSPAAPAPAASRLDRDHLVLRFGSGDALRLSQIAADDIDRLRGATVCGHAGGRFRLEERAGGPAAAIPLEGLLFATLPGPWMDAEPG